MTRDAYRSGGALAVDVRPATTEDVAAILGIQEQSPTASHWKAAEYGHMLRKGLLLVAVTERGELVGFLAAKDAAGEWEIENLAVLSSHQRFGVGSLLLEDLLRRAGKGCPVLLEVRASNMSARRFYENGGFVEVGRRRHYYCNPTEDAVLYRLQRDDHS